MAIIKFDTDEMIRSKNIIDNCAKEAEETIKKLEEAVSIMKEDWEGKDNLIYIMEMRKVLHSLYSLKTEIQTYSQQIRDVCENYSYAEATVINCIKQV